jgi:putative membrane protein
VPSTFDPASSVREQTNGFARDQGGQRGNVIDCDEGDIATREISMKLKIARRLTTALAGSLATVMIHVSAWAQPANDADRYGYGHHMMWEGGWPMFFFGPLFMIVTLAALVAVVILFARWFGGFPVTGPAGSPMTAPRSPLDILKERFASGEIDKKEYDERRRVLSD